MKLKLCILIYFFSINIEASSQCSPNSSQYPTSVYTPNSLFGSPTSCNYAGEYYSLNVVAGNTYEFSTAPSDGSNASYDTQLLLTDNNQAEISFNDDYSGSQSFISWVATYTGVAQIHLYEYNCGTNTTCTSIMCREISTNQSCISTFPYINDFETSLSWTAQGPSTIYTWLQNTGSTTSNSTGPIDASVFGSSVTSNCNTCNYAYCETSGSGATGTFLLVSPCFDMSNLTTISFSFSYHAYGATVGSIQLEGSTDGNTWSNLWNSSGQQQTSSSSAASDIAVDISVYAGAPEVYFRFNYTAGGSYTGDIAIDDISIEESNVPVACNDSYPYNNDFESGLIWLASGPTSSYNWLVNSGSTISSNTGPIDATVFGNDLSSNCSSCNYAYCETSGSGGTGIFTLTSDCFDLSTLSIPGFGFKYHAYGGTIGTLELETSIDLINWTSIWSVSGQQQFTDNQQATDVLINLNSISPNNNCYFRFNYTAGGSFTGDIAIDDIFIGEWVGPSTNIWIGINNSWSDAINWSQGLPDSTSDVYIPITSNNPVISLTDKNVKSIEILSGSSLTINNGMNLNVFGDWSCNGNIESVNGLGKITFKGINQNQLNGTNQDFYNIEIQNENGISINTGVYSVYGALYPYGGNIDINNPAQLIIASNAFNTGRIMDIKGYCSYTLQMIDSYGDGWNGGYLSVYSNGDLISNYAANGNGSTVSISLMNGNNISLEYNSGSWESENSYTLSDPDGNIVFSDGPSPSTGIVYSFISECDRNNPFNGDVTVRQYLDIPNNGWREFGSSVLNKTLADWSNDGILMTNFTGSDFPTFGWTNVYYYDENQANGDFLNGWVEASNITDSISPYRGHDIYIGTGIYNLELEGTPGFGKYSMDLNYENNSPQELTSNSDHKGWNLIGNPYACPIAWDSINSVNKIDIDNAFWVWSAEAGNYGVYVGGNGQGTATNNVNPEIAANQAFWVHANSNLANITFNETNKIDKQINFVKNYNLSSLKITINNQLNSFYDQLIIKDRINTGIGLDSLVDASKFFSREENSPEIWSKNNNDKISINNVDLSNELTLAIGYRSNQNGIHNLVFEIPENYKNIGCFIFEDNLLNTTLFIEDSMVYSFYSSTNTIQNNRFFIHFIESPTFSQINSDCYDNNNGSITITNNNIEPYTLANNNLLLSYINNYIKIDSLYPGNYQLNLINNVCPIVQLNVEINEPEQLFLSSYNTETTSSYNCDAEIRLEANGGVPPYIYMIDGIIGQNQTQLCEGNYFIEIIDSNNCFKNDTIKIESSVSINDQNKISFTIQPNPAQDYLYINWSKNTNVESIIITNIIGEIVLKSEKTNTKDGLAIFDLSLLPNGLYHVTLFDKNNNLSVEKIVKTD